MAKENLLLTLHKQHYSDYYEDVYTSQISCLGYYDEISIKEIGEDIASTRLSQKMSKAPLSSIWYATGSQIMTQTGEYSNQNIGLFRCVSDNKMKCHTELYWQKEGKLPFFAIGFLKLSNNVEYIELCKTIENPAFLDKVRKKEEECAIISYCTLDNADLVILLKSNNLALIEKAFKEIEIKDDVLYLHSILGIDEAYLEACSKSGGNVLEAWNGKTCCLNQPIKRIDFELVTSGSEEILMDIKYQWNKAGASIKGSEDIFFSHISGHGNVSIVLKDTDVRSLVLLLMPKGFLTHGNEAYNKELYNINSSLCIEEESWNILDAKELVLKNPQPDNWCRDVIEKFNNKIQKVDYKWDEAFYSYYQALIQTLNTLSQYERFKMSKDIYALIYPSLKMYEKQLQLAWDEMNDDMYKERIVAVKKTLCQYLECINSVIYHTIHTDQIYLMIPGYSGTSFSIPIKLSLFYMWFTDVISRILNDNQRQYSCILTPVMEAKPETGIIDFDRADQDKIICVKLSQRQLFFPRNLMIILSHELGHYIGKKIRCRTKRMKCLLKTYAYCICEGIMPTGCEVKANPQDDIEIWQDMVADIKVNLQILVLKLLDEKILEKRVDSEYHARDIILPLVEAGIEVLDEHSAGNEVVKLFHKITPEVIEKAVKRHGYVNGMRQINRVQEFFEQNRQKLLHSKVLEFIVKELIKLYREEFSDVSALAILKASRQDFCESFDVSEGIKLAKVGEPRQHTLRIAIADVVFFNESPKGAGTLFCSARSKRGIEREEIIEKYLMEKLFAFTWMQDNLLQYAIACKEELEKHLIQFPDLLEEVREVYNLFGTKEKSVQEIYDVLLNKINIYKQKVLPEYKKTVDGNDNNII